jgi:hypothetical protein
MYNPGVQYSSIPAAVSVLVRPDGCAEYRLAKNIQVTDDPEYGTVITADEVYFEVPADQTHPTVESVNEAFDTYWRSGQTCPVKPPTPEERLESLEADNLTALEAVAELYEMMTK